MIFVRAVNLFVPKADRSSCFQGLGAVTLAWPLDPPDPPRSPRPPARRRPAGRSGGLGGSGAKKETDSHTPPCFPLVAPRAESDSQLAVSRLNPLAILGLMPAGSEPVEPFGRAEGDLRRSGLDGIFYWSSWFGPAILFDRPTWWGGQPRAGGMG